MSFSRPDIASLASQLEVSDLNVKLEKKWKNFCDTVDLPDALVIDIEDEASLVEVVKQIYQHNNDEALDPKNRIIARCVAAEESYTLTDLATANVILRYKGEKRVEVVDEVNNIVRVSGSYQLGELNKLLYNKYGMVLPTGSLIPFVTVAGLAATAGHGTGRDQPAFTGLIMALTILKPDGTLKTIHRPKPGEEDVDHFETICSAHLGLFGVVVDVEIQCMPRQKLECTIEARSLQKFKDECDKGLFDEEFVEAIYMPTPGINGQNNDLKNVDKKNVQVRRMIPVSTDTNDVNNHPFWDHIVQQIEMKLEEKFHLADLLRLAPELTPFFMDYFATRGEIGETDSKVIGPWYDVWHYLTAYPRDIVDLDVLIPIDADQHQMHEIIELINEKLKNCADKGLFPINLGIYFRYFKGTKGALSTSSVNEDQHVLGLDFVALKGTRGVDKFIKDMSAILTGPRFKGKPHWGKNLQSDLKFKELYPDMPNYTNVLNQWYDVMDTKSEPDPSGTQLQRSAFLNTQCCQILELPAEYYPKPILNAAEENQQDESVLPINKSKSKMAAALARVISGESEAANNLRHALEKMAMPKRYDSSSNLFKGQSTLNEIQAEWEKAAEQKFGDMESGRGSCPPCILY